ncbi:hypothetical protein J2S57_000534 [Kineosporia succinea]|uniref:Uncharacterized protein n=1 Tax=Kineosporia succinea TaxID=84632 RepID=A0ABT9NWJ1_9ACTN|nr:hypothetical protein [Kineosporia succinea]
MGRGSRNELDRAPPKRGHPLTGTLLHRDAPSQGRSFAGRPLTGRSLTGHSLTGRSLTGHSLTGRSLTGHSLTRGGERGTPPLLTSCPLRSKGPPPLLHRVLARATGATPGITRQPVHVAHISPRSHHRPPRPPLVERVRDRAGAGDGHDRDQLVTAPPRTGRRTLSVTRLSITLRHPHELHAARAPPRACPRDDGMCPTSPSGDMTMGKVSTTGFVRTSALGVSAIQLRPDRGRDHRGTGMFTVQALVFGCGARPGTA